MKQKLRLTLELLLIHCVAFSQVCLPNGISTNPDNPINTEAPTNSPEHWLNRFEWYANDGTTLFDIAIHDMFISNPNQITMSNPFSSENPYPIAQALFDDLDMLPSDGWELISVNLGYYPNLELLSEQQPPDGSSFAEVPYILLYNKYRGILRLFASTLTGLSAGFDNVLVLIQFENSLELSGVLRHFGTFDQALDQPTITNGALTITTQPFDNNPSLWFWSDFQVGYDPCTCNFKSDFRLNFYFTDDLTLNMVSNQVSTTINAINENGTTTIPEDFLSSVQYNQGFQGAGLFVYNNINEMIDDYLDRLEQIEAYNLGIGEANRKIKRKRYILKAIKFVAEVGYNNYVTPALADSLTKYASDVLGEIGLDGIKLDGSKLREEGKKLLGQGFDWLSKEWVSDTLGEKPSPTAPTAMISSATFNGTFTNTTWYPGPLIMNPGTYPSGTGHVSINPHNYPVYNEVLGLFALLNKPKLHYFSSEWATLENFSTGTWLHISGNVHVRSTPEIHRNKLHKFWLAEPLKFVFNPAAGIDEENVQIDAAIILERNLPSLPQEGFGPITAFFPALQNPNSFESLYSYQYKLVFDEAVKTEISLNNILFTNSDGTSLSSNRNVELDMEYETPFVDLSNFNTLVASMHTKQIEKYEVKQWSSTQPSNSNYLIYAQNSLLQSNYAYQPDNIEDYLIKLKLIVKMPFTTLDENGNTRFTEQVFTYLINPTTDLIPFIPTSGDSVAIPWSLTFNPTGGAGGIQANQTFSEKEWGIEDHVIWGGPSNSSTQVHATESITFFGNQTLSAETNNVEFIAGQEITVRPGTELLGEFTLRIEDFVQMTSSPTPTVSGEYLQTFCEAQVPNSYRANRPTRELTASAITKPSLINDNSNFLRETKITLYPNPASEVVSLDVSGFDPVVRIEIFNHLGSIIRTSNLPISFTQKAKIETSTLSNGVYEVRCILRSGQHIIKPLIVVH